MALWPAEALFRVRGVDFSKLQKDKGQRMASNLRMMSRVSGEKIDPNDPQINTAPRMALEQFIAESTKGRLIETSGPAWAGFRKSGVQTLSGASTELADHLSVGRGSKFLYFATSTAPLSEIAGRFSDGNPFYYVAIADGGVQYLEVLFQRPQGAMQDAPSRLQYPCLHQAVWFFIAGLLGYALIPWYLNGANELRYSTARSMVVPDLMGVVMVSVFFAMPFLIISHNASSMSPFALLDFTDGWGILTVVFWLFALGIGSIIAVALWYATFSLSLRPDSLGRRTLFADEDYPYAEITSVEPAVKDWPKWLIVASWLVVLFGSARHSLQMGGMLLARQRNFGIKIRSRNRRDVFISINYLPDFNRLFHALKQHGVPLHPELASAIEENPGLATDTPATTPGPAGRIAAIILLVLVVGGAQAWHYWPEPRVKVERKLTYSTEALAQRMQLTEQMRQITLQMNKALELQKSSTPAERAQGASLFDALMKQHDDLEKRYNAIQPTEEE